MAFPRMPRRITVECAGRRALAVNPLTWADINNYAEAVLWLAPIASVTKKNARKR